MKIPDKGLKKEEILKTLRSYKNNDMDWKTGKVMGYIYDAGEEVRNIINDAYTMYLTENALDPLTYPSLLRLENEVVGMLANLLQGDENIVGNFTSGGTESIMMAVLSARNRARALKPHIKEPEIVFPMTAHAAFYKAAHYLGVKAIPVAVKDETFLADIDAMRKSINENTILIVGSAPGYAHGVVDPIEEIGKLALENNLLFHVDGCVGGIHLSYMRKLGMQIPRFDFSVPSVTSLSVDLHKYGYSAKNASMILYKSKDIRRYQIFACSRWPGYTVVNATAGSSKTGGPMAAAWAVLNFLGNEGYMKIVKDVMQATKLMIEGINNIEGLKVNGSPDMCMFSFHSTIDKLNVYRIADDMKFKKGWYIQPQFARGNSESNLHISFTYTTIHRAEEMLNDLKEIVAEILNEKTSSPPSDFSQAMQNVDFKLDEETFNNLLEMAGISKESLPTRMEDINKILEVLPYDLCEYILISYVNNIMKPGE